MAIPNILGAAAGGGIPSISAASSAKSGDATGGPINAGSQFTWSSSKPFSVGSGSASGSATATADQAQPGGAGGNNTLVYISIAIGLGSLLLPLLMRRNK